MKFKVLIFKNDRLDSILLLDTTIDSIASDSTKNIENYLKNKLKLKYDFIMVEK